MHQLIRFACLIVLVSGLPSHAAAPDDDQDQTRQSAGHESPTNEIALEQAGGIKTDLLRSTTKQPEYLAYGKVLSLEPLISLRQQYLAAQAMQDSAEARYRESDLNLNRTRDLHRQDIVSTRRLQEQQARWRNDKANLATSSYQQQSILASSRLQWGDTLTAWFTESQNRQADRFLNHHAQLLLITLPPDHHLAADIQAIDVDENGRRSQAVKAKLISPAPQVDPITQSERYYFMSEDRIMPYGAHVSAWVAGDKPGGSGVIIPDTAVVWHLGQAFVFIKNDDGSFSRRLLHKLESEKGGYFASSGFQAGEEIVITGAQTLLSQELKNLIPSEDDD